ncbi:hypothetical protein ABT150_44380 [Streptomyces mirabilis]
MRDFQLAGQTVVDDVGDAKTLPGGAGAPAERLRARLVVGELPDLLVQGQ